MKIIITILFSVSVSLLFGQKYAQIDLGSRNSKEVSIGLEFNGIEVISLCPSKTYKFKMKVEEIKDGGESSVASGVEILDSFNSFRIAYNDLKTIMNESEVKEKIKNLENEYKKIEDGNIKKSDLRILKDELISQTKEIIYFDFGLRKNQLIRFWVFEVDEGKEIKEWYNSFSTPTGLNFVTHFGFTYGLNTFKTPNNFYSFDIGSPGGASDSFKVTKLNSNGADFLKDLSITANFLFPIRNKRNKGESDLKFAWLAGFGLGGETRFSVFTGPALMLQDFVALGFVIGMTNTYKLNGIYKEGQILKENLNFDQLHQTGIRPDLMFTLSFRLSKKQVSGEVEIVN